MPNTEYSDNFHCPEEDPLYSSGRMAVGDYYLRYHLSTEGLLVGSYPDNDGVGVVEHTYAKDKFCVVFVQVLLLAKNLWTC